jgi:hypothetical protein
VAAPGNIALPPLGEPGPATPLRGRWLRRIVLVVVIAVGLAGVGGGGFGLYRELTRPATHAEVATAVRAEIASRWARLPTAQIFPRSVAYRTAEGMDTAARLVGIAPPAACATALDPVIAQAFARHGCIKVLRATYVDASGTVVVTAGVAVLPSGTAAARAAADVNSDHHAGVRVVAFPQTVTNLFRNSGRESLSILARGPYVFLSAVGYTTGLTGRRLGANPALGDLGAGVANREIVVLTGARKPCQRKDIRC